MPVMRRHHEDIEVLREALQSKLIDTVNSISTAQRHLDVEAFCDVLGCRKMMGATAVHQENPSIPRPRLKKIMIHTADDSDLIPSQVLS
ncbi:hypothetical protein D3C77_519970 [compost metagenome]